MEGLKKLDPTSDRTKKEWIEHFFRVTDYYIAVEKWQDEEIERLRAELDEALERIGKLQLFGSQIAAERDSLRVPDETKDDR